MKRKSETDTFLVFTTKRNLKTLFDRLSLFESEKSRDHKTVYFERTSARKHD